MRVSAGCTARYASGRSCWRASDTTRKDSRRTPTSAGQGKTGPGRTLGNGPGAEREPLAVLQSPAESFGSGEDGGYDVGICRLAVVSVDTRGCLCEFLI